MRFETQAWRKLYVAESMQHRLLPVLCRGLRDYLLRYAAEDGTLLAKTDDPAHDLAKALGSHPEEIETIVRYVETWLGDGFLAHKKGRLVITKYTEAQSARSPGATRQKRYRDSQRYVTGDATEPSDSDARDTSQEKRREEKRNEDPTPVSPPPGAPPARPKRRQSADVPDLLPPDWEPPAESVEAQATRWNASEAHIRRTIPEFRVFWIGEQKRKNKAGWLRAWTNRVAALAKRGELWVDDLRNTTPRQFGKPTGLVLHEQFSVPMSQDKAAALVASVRRKQES